MDDQLLSLYAKWMPREIAATFKELYLDCIVLKVRQDSRVINKSVFLALGINIEGQKELSGMWLAEKSLFRILCKCLFSEVIIKAVTELDNKAAHCHTPVLQRHRLFLGCRLDCQPHHFFTDSSVGNTLRISISAG